MTTNPAQEVDKNLAKSPYDRRSFGHPHTMKQQQHPDTQPVAPLKTTPHFDAVIPTQAPRHREAHVGAQETRKQAQSPMYADSKRPQDRWMAWTDHDTPRRLRPPAYFLHDAGTEAEEAMANGQY